MLAMWALVVAMMGFIAGVGVGRRLAAVRPGDAPVAGEVPPVPLPDDDLAVIDALTGLANQRELDGKLHRRLAAGAPVGVIILRAEQEGLIRERYGATFADNLLRVMAEKLQRCVRSGDLAARPGGAEFVVVVSAVDQAALLRLAGRLAEAITGPVSLGAISVDIRVSVGLAWTRKRGTPAALLDWARGSIPPSHATASPAARSRVTAHSSA